MKEIGYYIEDYTRVEDDTNKKASKLIKNLPFDLGTKIKIGLCLRRLEKVLAIKKTDFKDLYGLESDPDIGEISSGDTLIVSDFEKYYPLKYSNIFYARVTDVSSTTCFFNKFPIARVENTTGKLHYPKMMDVKSVQRNMYHGQIARWEAQVVAVLKAGSERFKMVI